MRIEKIEWRNILSYGNKTEVLEFGDAAKLWQVSGRSGNGKTALLSIPKLLLYGRTEGWDGKAINVGDIANRTNKNGWIRGEITEGNDKYVIERCFSPQSIKVWKNGKDLDKAGIRDMQGIIDAEILDNMPYNIFSNVVMVSMHNFKSFISMSPTDKRQIIDKIFNLEVINKVYELIKKDKRDLGVEINNSNSQKYVYSQNLETAKRELQALEQRVITKTDEQKDVYQQKLEIVDKLYNQYNGIYNAKQMDYNTAQVAERTAYTNMLSWSNKCSEIQKKLDLFKMEKCPTCGTPFSGDGFDHIREGLEKEYAEYYDMYVNAAAAYKAAGEHTRTLYSDVDKARLDVQQILNKRSEITGRLNSLTSQDNTSAQTQSIQKIISDTQEKMKLVDDGLDVQNDKMNLLSIMENMYSADGIKQQIMENYIPILNEEIATTLTALSFPYTLEFDSNFEPHLEELGEPIKPQTLSIGEHKKVDLAVLCAVLRMIKRKYPQINLVCLDEVLSNMDYMSSTDIITYLKDIATSMNLNIFVVSHTTLEESLFDVKILVDKNSGFSNLTYL